MAFDLDDEELRATRKDKGLDDGLYEETSDRNAVNDRVIAHKFVVMQQQLEQKDKKIQELEEENKNLKASHIFTRNNNATDEEKAKLYDVIDNTIDTFFEQENPKWKQIMTINEMSVDKAIDIVDDMYQDRYKIIEEKTEEGTTIHLEKIDNVKFTNLEFASVILLREVQSLQRKLENSTPKQKVKEALEDIEDYFERLNGPDKDIDYIRRVKQELLEKEKSRDE